MNEIRSEVDQMEVLGGKAKHRLGYLVVWVLQKLKQMSTCIRKQLQ